MPPLSPKQKQALSGLAVALLTGACVALEEALRNPPFTLRMLLSAALVGAIGGVLHRIPALGTEQAVVEKIIEREPTK